MSKWKPFKAGKVNFSEKWIIKFLKRRRLFVKKKTPIGKGLLTSPQMKVFRAWPTHNSTQYTLIWAIMIFVVSLKRDKFCRFIFLSLLRTYISYFNKPQLKSSILNYVVSPIIKLNSLTFTRGLSGSNISWNNMFIC